MHELSVTSSIIEACSERADGARVLRVTLEVGTLTCVLPQALRFCFEVATEGTLLEGAVLEVQRVPGRSRCRRCGRSVELHDMLAACVCGSVDLDPPEGGDSLRVKSMELAQPAEPRDARIRPADAKPESPPRPPTPFQ